LTPDLAVSQSDFQRRAFSTAQMAHSAADRADARILMRMVEAVDEGDILDLYQLSLALQARYLDELGPIPDQVTSTPSGDSTSSQMTAE
jgi:hypothetical protein